MKSEEINPRKQANKTSERKTEVEGSLQPDYNQDLIFDPEKQSYTYDVDDREDSYDHPLPYESVSKGAVNDDSTFDEANPYVGDEYDTQLSPNDSFKQEYGMHIDETGKILNTSKKDKMLSHTEEDEREDLDEEGYPKK